MGQIIQFTKKDVQTENWVYYVSYREGNRLVSDKRGARKAATKKWSGVAKKESQIGNRGNGRLVTLIDMERTIPLRCLSKTLYLEAKGVETESTIDSRVAEYLGYIYERTYEVNQVFEKSGNYVYSYRTADQYSSYNTATGEDALTRILRDICEADPKSLVLIDEVESGLHPKVQRRLMDVIYHESRANQKQFILTTHSSTILAAVEPESRIFLNKVGDETHAQSHVSINEALSHMDSVSHPLLQIFVEDEVAKKIVDKAISEICLTRHGFNYLIKTVMIGSADKTYNYFKTTQSIYDNGNRFVDIGYACILDGDMRDERDHAGQLKFPSEDLLFFLYTNYAPEKMLLEQYIIMHPDESLRFYLSQNPHCVLGKMVEMGFCVDTNAAFDMCWESLVAIPAGRAFVEELKNFLLHCCQHFSRLF